MDRITNLTLDFETYFDFDYSLKKQKTIAYVRDPRFKLHGAAYKLDDGPTEWIRPDQLGELLSSIEGRTNLICQNTYFDGLILFTHYRWVPDRYSDTLSMARAVLHHQKLHDLDSVAATLKIGNKLGGVLPLTRGIRDLSPELWAKLGDYARNDVDLTYAVYQKLLPAFPPSELDLIDLTLRWSCCPTLHVDVGRVLAAYKAAARDRRAKIKASGTTKEVLSSNPKFIAHCKDLGLEIPSKVSPSTGKRIPALAKGDLEFKNFMADHVEHFDLWQGRLAAKSTIEQTRCRTIYKVGKSGTMPMPLKYYGAHTGRWSGDDGLNVQNFTRGSELRKSIIAPPGYVIIVADLKQIELRTNMWFCDEESWLNILATGGDVYRVTASNYYGTPLDEVTPAERFVGKTMELGLGYRMGWRKFRKAMALEGVYMDEGEAYRAVSTYRQTHARIANMWRILDQRIANMYQGFDDSFKCLEFTDKAVVLPNGMLMDYPNLQPTEDNNWVYESKGKMKYLHGGSFLENLIQAIARIIVGEQMLAIKELNGITIVSSSHDEILAVARKNEADQAQKAMEAVMTTPPTWAPNLPLAVEAGYAKEYSK